MTAKTYGKLPQQLRATVKVVDLNNKHKELLIRKACYAVSVNIKAIDFEVRLHIMLLTTEM